MTERNIIKHIASFETLVTGRDLTGDDWNWSQYGSDVGTFLVSSGQHGEVKATSGSWAGGFILDKAGASAWANYTVEFDVKSHASGRFIFGFLMGAAAGYWYQCIPGGAGESKVLTAARDFITGQALVEANTPPATVTHVKIVLTAGNIKIYLNGSATAQHDIDDSTFTSGTIGVSAYLGGWEIDNLSVAVDYDNATIIKRSLLRPTTTIGLSLNLGDSLAADVDITRHVANITDVTEKLTVSSTGSGGVILPSVVIKLDNRRGMFNRDAGYFRTGFINGTMVTIDTKYIDPDGEEVTPGYSYRGILKSAACTWNRLTNQFEATLFPATNLLATEKVMPGTLSPNTFTNLIYAMLNRQPFLKYMTVSLGNIDLGWDVVADSITEMVNETVKTVLDKIMLLTGSIYYIDYDGAFIVEPAEPTSPEAVCTFRGDDIEKVVSESFDWQAQSTAVVWNDGENAVQRAEMTYTEREQYQYDYVPLDLTMKYVTTASKRTTIIDNLLDARKYLKRMVDISCKWNPEVTVNKYVALDVPKEAIIGDEFLIWNDGQWNDGKYWGIDSPGISFPSTDLWRVVEVRRDPLGSIMRLKLVQLYSDDER